ncbi:MAG TPA: SLBB domain-containing protein [Rubricoccaceae bacterium]|nr:SLBB domain-containing protein [Rubricoccaceae bacterium]
MFNPPRAVGRPDRRWHLALTGVLLALVAALASPAHAQGIDVPRASSPLQLGQRLGTEAALGLPTAPLEGALDPARYLVGPGDVFAVSIGGQLPVQYRTTVSAEGVLVIPDVGAFRAADRFLADVKAEVGAALQRTYRNVETSVALAEPRRFYVHVSGAVVSPGRILAPPVPRVEDALLLAMGGVTPRSLAESGPARQALAARALRSTATTEVEPGMLQPREDLLGARYRPSLRNVRVTHRDGTAALVDLLRYYATGDPESNPYLRDGDAVHVPFFDPDESGVGVAGAVADPGVYDVRPDDTARDLLVVALGPAADDVRAVRLVRAATGEATVLSPADLATTPVAAGDRLFVLDEAAAQGTVEAVGAVRFPASYPIVEGRTTLRELVEMAGGFEDDALVRGAYLERRGPWAAGEGALDAAAIVADPTVELELRQAALAAAAYDRARLSPLDFLGRQYLAREVVGYQRVSVDVDAALSEGAAPVFLRDGDRLVVPRDPGAVAVIGQVARGGYVPFAEGRDAEDYIAEAGGRAPGAADAYVVDAATGAYRLAAEAGPLHSGDVVFVNRTPVADDLETQQVVVQERQLERQEQRDRADARFRLISTTLQAVSVAATVIAIILRN